MILIVSRLENRGQIVQKPLKKLKGKIRFKNWKGKIRFLFEKHYLSS